MNYKKAALIGLTIFSLISMTFIVQKDFKWKFKNFKKLTFKYEQTMSNDSPSSFDNMKMKTKLEGFLTITVKEESFADIVLRDLNNTMYILDSLGDTTSNMSQKMPDMFIQDLKEDGTIEGELNQQTQILARILFPVINKPISIGDSIDLPMSLNFNIMGSNVKVKGYNRVKYIETVNDIDKLETVINVSEFKLPAEVKNKYICYTKGTSKFDFNSQKGYFTAGDYNVIMAIGMEDTSSSDGFGDLSVIMKSQIKLQLINVE